MFRIKYSREIVLKLLYQMDVLGMEDVEAENILHDNLNFFRSLTREEKAYVSKIIDHVINRRAAIDRAISKHLIGWSLPRLNMVDRNLLRMGIAEAVFNDQKAIIIDDMVRMAKKYGEEESYKIINAILDKVIK